MKTLVTLAAVLATMAFSVATAEAGKGQGKQNNYASQYTQGSNWQSQTSLKLKPTQSSQWQGQSSWQGQSQSQSYQGNWNGQSSQQSYAKLKPSYPVQQTGMSQVPKFGFDSTFGWNGHCLGEHVTHVYFGGPASRLGLESGDAIVGVNGQDLKTANCWYNALNRAAGQDGWVTLKIVDKRTGKLAYRTANLFQLSR